MTPRHLEVLADPAAVAARAAHLVVARLAAATREHGRASFALGGGSTPRAMNAVLAAGPYAKRLDWTSVDFWFGDERCVPPDDDASNYRMNRETLLEPLAIPPAHVHRMRGEDDPERAAAAYDAELRERLGAHPRLDAVVLGMGPDGHTASLFPGTLGTIDERRRCVANRAPVGVAHRLTLTPAVLNDAHELVVAVTGAEKAEALAAVLDGPPDPDRYPAQVLAPRRGTLWWLVDEAAAARLAERTA